MRKPFICGNWKMNKNVEEAEAMITELKDKVEAVENVEMGICPTALCLTTVKEAAHGSDIVTGAENIYWKDSGAQSGEISAKMLADSGIEYTIVGHSERREIFGESDYEVNKSFIRTGAWCEANCLCRRNFRRKKSGYTRLPKGHVLFGKRILESPTFTVN